MTNMRILKLLGRGKNSWVWHSHNKVKHCKFGIVSTLTRIILAWWHKTWGLLMSLDIEWILHLVAPWKFPLVAFTSHFRTYNCQFYYPKVSTLTRWAYFSSPNTASKVLINLDWVQMEPCVLRNQDSFHPSWQMQ